MANQDVLDLRKALQTFTSDVQDFQRSRVIQQANEEVNAIRSSAESEAKKRQALQNIANNLVGQLAFHGTPATTIQQVAGAFGPQQIKTAEEAILQGELQGQPELVEAGTRAAAASPKAALAQEQRAFKSEEAAKERELKRELSGNKLKAQMKKEELKLDPDSRKELSTNFSVIDAIQDLNGEVDKLSDVARIAGGYGGARASAQLARARSKAESLKVTIARAAESGVLSDQDLKRYNEILGGLGDFKTLGAFKAGYAAFAFKSANLIRNRLKTLENEGKSVEANRARLNSYNIIKEDAGQAQPMATPATAPGLPVGAQDLGVKMVNGKVGRAYKLPNGRTIFKAQ